MDRSSLPQQKSFNPPQPNQQKRFNAELLLPPEPSQPSNAGIPYATRVDSDSSFAEASEGMLEYLRILRRHRKLVIALSVVGILAGIVVSLCQTPVYRAKSLVEIEYPPEAFSSKGNTTVANPLFDVRTQVKLLQSLTLRERVKTLMQGGPSNSGAKDSGAKDPGAKNESDSGWLRSLHLPFFSPPISREDALSIASKSLDVKDERDSRVLEITADAPDAQLAAGFTNTLVQEYSKQILEERWNSYQRTGNLLTRAQEELRDNLQKSEKKLHEYASAKGLLFTSETNTVAEDRLKQIQEELSRAEADRILKQSQYGIIASTQQESLPQVLEDQSLRQYQAQLSDLRRQYAELSTSLTPAHYKVKQVKAQIAELEQLLEKQRATIVKRLRNEYESARSRERLLAGNYAAQSGMVSNEAAKLIEYNMLKREVETNRQLYEAALQKGKEASISSALQTSNIRVVDSATPPLLPYRPNHILNAGLGLASGLLMGVMFAFLRDRSNKRIETPSDLPYYLNVRELGVIPSAQIDPEVRALKKGRTPLSLGVPAGEKGVELITWTLKPCLMAESYRAVLASILFSTQNEMSPEVILLTSPNPKEGKSTIISNLAIALAEIKGRVLLIDADMRNPRLHKVFDTLNSWGLSDVLQEDAPIKEYPEEMLSRPTKVPGLFLLPSGPGTLSVSSLLYSTRMNELLKRCRQQFETVLIDTAPMLQFPDARILAGLSDAVILVFRAGQTEREEAQAALQRFEDDGKPVLGCILNDWDPSTTGSDHHVARYAQYYSGANLS